MNYTAFVPARCGSKRLPNKNIKELAGKPLIVWTLQACVEVKKIDKVILSTDSMEYWDVANKHIKSDKLELDYRNSEDAGDTIKIFDYLKESRDKIFKNRDGAFILALPTVPLRQSHHIDEAISQYENNNVPVFSATNYGFPISFAFYSDEQGNWSPVLAENPMNTGNTRSQNQHAAYHPNGAIYVRSINDLSDKELVTLYQDAKPYLMDREASVDIDREIDFTIAEALF
jgi:CMP-N,N'-diacetyllegionaminic acid synthase